MKCPWCLEWRIVSSIGLVRMCIEDFRSPEDWELCQEYKVEAAPYGFKDVSCRG